MKQPRQPQTTSRKSQAAGLARSCGVALIMVLIVLSILAMIGTPFVISMALQDKESVNFAGATVARLAAEAARNHAIAGLEDTVRGVEFGRESELLEEERPSWITDSAPGNTRSPLRTPRTLRGRAGDKTPTGGGRIIWNVPSDGWPTIMWLPTCSC